MKRITIITTLLILLSLSLSADNWVTSTSGVIYTTTSNVGIGTSAPGAKLQVNAGELWITGTNDTFLRTANSYNSGNWRWIFRNTTDDGSFVIMQCGDGWQNEGERLVIKRSGNIGIGTYNPTTLLHLSHSLAARITFERTDFSHKWWIGTDTGPAGFMIYDQTSAAYRLFIADNGCVGIGTISPDQVLTVKGKIHAQEMIVDTSISDYVFTPNYDLLTLRQVDRFIKENGHLPGIPSQLDVSESGVNLGEFNRILLQKVEELTLYAIKQDQLIEQFFNEIEKMKDEK